MAVDKFFQFPSWALVLFLVVLGFAAAPGQAQTVTLLMAQKRCL